MSEYRVGDRVRVTFEAEVVGDGAPSSACLCSFEYGNRYRSGAKIRETYLRQEGVEVEKIAPPVETFGPGDVVRNLESNTVVVLSDKGFVNTHTGKFLVYGERNANSVTGYWTRADEFTSDRYERVDIS